MNPDTLPPNESENLRIEDLRSLGILDTPPEEPFDGIAEVAAALFETPVALVTLIGSETQWFKAKVGTHLGSNVRAESFCNVTIQGATTLVVPDATLDARFAGLPCVIGMGIRFYAGTPLVTNRGQAVGTLCLLDVRPRDFEPRQRRLLERMARQAVDALESRRLVQHLIDLLIETHRESARAFEAGWSLP